jgi:hypothetical protein
MGATRSAAGDSSLVHIEQRGPEVPVMESGDPDRQLVERALGAGGRRSDHDGLGVSEPERRSSPWPTAIRKCCSVTAAARMPSIDWK